MGLSDAPCIWLGQWPNSILNKHDTDLNINYDYLVFKISISIQTVHTYETFCQILAQVIVVCGSRKDNVTEVVTYKLVILSTELWLATACGVLLLQIDKDGIDF